MRYPNSITARATVRPRPSGPSEPVRPLPLPRPRRKPGRPQPHHPRRPAPPRTYPAGSPKGPTPPPQKRTRQSLPFGSWLNTYARHLRLGVFSGAIETLMQFRTSGASSPGWNRVATCRNDYDIKSGHLSTLYCGPYGVPAQVFDKESVPTKVHHQGLSGVTLVRYTEYILDAYRLNVDPGSPGPDRFSFRENVTTTPVNSSHPAWSSYGEAMNTTDPDGTVHIASSTPHWYRPPRSVAALVPLGSAVGPQWLPMVLPGLYAPGQSPGIPAPKPLNVPRPEPWSPESPAVGPRPEARPRPVVSVPGASPGSAFDVTPGRNPRPLAPPSGVAKPPPKGTKEGKVRMSPMLAGIWHGIGGFTEVLDLDKILYEALPRWLKAKIYRELGRQPRALERLLYVYRHMNDLDLPKVFHEVIKNEIEDRMYAAGSRQMREANRRANRPIGYEAGGSLTGGGEYINVPGDSAPPWWPSIVPWAP